MRESVLLCIPSERSRASPFDRRRKREPVIRSRQLSLPIMRARTYLTTSDSCISSESNDSPHDELQSGKKNLMMSFRRRREEAVVFDYTPAQVSTRHHQGSEETYPYRQNYFPVLRPNNRIPPIDPTTPLPSTSALLPSSKPVA